MTPTAHIHIYMCLFFIPYSIFYVLKNTFFVVPDGTFYVSIDTLPTKISLYFAPLPQPGIQTLHLGIVQLDSTLSTGIQTLHLGIVQLDSTLSTDKVIATQTRTNVEHSHS